MRTKFECGDIVRFMFCGTVLEGIVTYSDEAYVTVGCKHGSEHLHRSNVYLDPQTRIARALEALAERKQP